MPKTNQITIVELIQKLQEFPPESLITLSDHKGQEYLATGVVEAMPGTVRILSFAQPQPDTCVSGFEGQELLKQKMEQLVKQVEPESMVRILPNENKTK